MNDRRTDREGGGISATKERKRFRFSLKALVLIMTMFAFCMGAYLVGYRNGYKAAKDESQADYVIWMSNQNN